MDPPIPYTCVYIDADISDFANAACQCFSVGQDREKLIQDVTDLWENDWNQNHVLPVLSVRTGLDLFLRVKNYPAGSEVIMSAINIPDMAQIVRHHGLKVVPLDISIDTAGPKPELLEKIVSDKTVAILIAHIYGKWTDMDPIIEFAQEHKLAVIEDCAEVFCGFDRIGDPRSDICLFSFGVIKFYTAFGGGIAKVKDDDLYHEMKTSYDSYSTQGRAEYLKKVVKYFIVFLFLDCPRIIKPAMYFTRTFGIDHKKIVVKFLRGFPDKMVERIRNKPSTALLTMLRRRMYSFSKSDFENGQVKGEYVRERLPGKATLVGMQSLVNNYWLFPILVESPDNIVKLLNIMGIDAYRGATQLNIIEPEHWKATNNGGYPVNPRYPQEAKYLIDHVVYIPVHKNVPFHILDKVVKSVKVAIKMNEETPKVRLRSKV